MRTKGVEKGSVSKRGDVRKTEAVSRVSSSKKQKAKPVKKTPSKAKKKPVKKAAEKKAVEKVLRPGIQKQYLKSGNMCNVTFSMPKEAASGAGVINIVGDFNNWDLSATPMKKMKNGDFKVKLKLQCGREYRFRYLIDATRWENDWNADAYVPNAFGSDDSLVKV